MKISFKVFRAIIIIGIIAAVVIALVMGDVSGFNNTYLGK